MPELPDVAAFREYLDRHGLRKKIQDVEVTTTKVLKGVSARRLRETLKGRKLRKSRRHGKLLIVEVGDHEWMVMHFGMTGFLKYYKDARDRPEHAGMIIHYANDCHLAYDCQRLFGHIELTEKIDRYLQKQKLGPDALSVDKKRFKEVIREHKKQIKSLLMDQSVIAGIGNVYADEILYQAKIDPRRKTGDLMEQEVGTLHRTLHRVLEKATEVQSESRRTPRGWLLAVREDGAECPRCKGKVRSLRVGGRRGFWCPDCQG